MSSKNTGSCAAISPSGKAHEREGEKPRAPRQDKIHPLRVKAFLCATIVSCKWPNLPRETLRFISTPEWSPMLVNRHHKPNPNLIFGSSSGARREYNDLATPPTPTPGGLSAVAAVGPPVLTVTEHHYCESAWRPIAGFSEGSMALFEPWPLTTYALIQGMTHLVLISPME